MLFPVAPDVFHGIQFGSVGGEVFDMDSAAELLDIVANQPTTVSRQAVPNQQQRSTNVPYQSLQKIEHLGSLYRTDVQPEIEAQKRESGDYR